MKRQRWCAKVIDRLAQEFPRDVPADLGVLAALPAVHALIRSRVARA
jgi:hypothetical protein